MAARDLREYSGSLSLQGLVFGSDHDIAAAAEVIEVGLVGVIDQSGDSLFAFGEGAVQGDDSRALVFRSSGMPRYAWARSSLTTA